MSHDNSGPGEAHRLLGEPKTKQRSPKKPT